MQVNNSHPYIKPNPAYNTIKFLVIITLGIYAPFFTNQFIKKLNIMTKSRNRHENQRICKTKLPYRLGYNLVSFGFDSRRRSFKCGGWVARQFRFYIAYIVIW